MTKPTCDGYTVSLACYRSKDELARMNGSPVTATADGVEDGLLFNYCFSERTIADLGRLFCEMYMLLS